VEEACPILPGGLLELVSRYGVHEADSRLARFFKGFLSGANQCWGGDLAVRIQVVAMLDLEVKEMEELWDFPHALSILSKLLKAELSLHYSDAARHPIPLRTLEHLESYFGMSKTEYDQDQVRHRKRQRLMKMLE